MLFRLAESGFKRVLFTALVPRCRTAEVVVPVLFRSWGSQGKSSAKGMRPRTGKLMLAKRRLHG